MAVQGAQMVTDAIGESTGRGGLQAVSLNRLACLYRHWRWADEAKRRFEQSLSRGWEFDADPLADHLVGAYYHWCALLCGVSDATLSEGLLSAWQRDTRATDLQGCLPLLRTCRDVLVSVPASREQQPRLVDVLRDGETLRRLRRVHGAFGDALREEHQARELEFLDTQER